MRVPLIRRSSTRFSGLQLDFFASSVRESFRTVVSHTPQGLKAMTDNPRRQFITQAAALATLPLLSSIGKAQAPGRKLGVALCGLGSLSTNQIAPALQKTRFCQLAGIVTGTPSKAAEWQKKYGLAEKNIYNYQNMHEMASNPDIDIVYVVTPNALHM